MKVLVITAIALAGPAWAEAPPPPPGYSKEEITQIACWYSQFMVDEHRKAIERMETEGRKSTADMGRVRLMVWLGSVEVACKIDTTFEQNEIIRLLREKGLFLYSK